MFVRNTLFAILLALAPCAYAESDVSSEQHYKILTTGMIALPSEETAPKLIGGMISFGDSVRYNADIFINIGYLQGSENLHFIDEFYHVNTKVELQTIPLTMSGIIRHDFSEYFSCYTGITFGAHFSNWKIGSITALDGCVSRKTDYNEFNFMGGAQAGFNVNFTKNFGLFVGYELWFMGMNDPYAHVLEYNEDYHDNFNPLYHVLKAGFTFSF